MLEDYKRIMFVDSVENASRVPRIVADNAIRFPVMLLHKS